MKSRAEHVSNGVFNCLYDEYFTLLKSQNNLYEFLGYTPEEMVGKKVMVVTNLKPAKLAGMISEGMILCTEDAEGNVVLMQPEKDVPAGAEIG
jgi:tRNA-binding EMAP/Myf-like protein